jgi:hypothetical protein
VSNHLISEVYKRKVGNIARKAVMVLLADKASDDGSGIWASKQRMADEVGASKQTIIATLKSLVDDKLVVERGQRKCTNGYTVEYAINVAALKRLPLVKSHSDDQSEDLTGQVNSPVKRVDATSQAALPDQSENLTQTLLNPTEPPELDSAPDDALTPEDIRDSWNEMAERFGLPLVKTLNKARRAQAKARLREHPRREDWNSAFRCIAQNTWMHGDNERGWRADFDFLLQAKSFIKLVENSYGKN